MDTIILGIVLFIGLCRYPSSFFFFFALRIRLSLLPMFFESDQPV
jgi:hypothetical protein